MWTGDRALQVGLALPRVSDVWNLRFKWTCGIIAALLSLKKEGMTLLSDYSFIGIFVVVAIVFPFVALGMAWLLRPKKPNPVKTNTYECGLETIGDTWVQFRAQYYVYALVFVVFDIEAAFLFPWAVAYDKLGLWALAEVFLFLAILTVGLVYAWRKGALRWQ
jgi:NADH:ubiquinone oxidoreductase subunit 3 (subunit A)